MRVGFHFLNREDNNMADYEVIAEPSEGPWETKVIAKLNHLLLEMDADEKRLRIHVTGRTGAGKSALVNSIVGKYVAIEGDYLLGETAKVTRYDKKVGDVDVWIYYSPCLQDGINDKKVEGQYLQDLQDNCKGVDLNLYCVKMNDTLRESEKHAIVKLSNSFGMDEFWRNTLIVLTFANKVQPSKSSSSTPEDFFSKRMVQWKTLLTRILKENTHIAEEVIENIPIIPAGYSDEPSLPAAKCDYWLSDLWFQCLDRTRNIGKPILLNLNLERLRPTNRKKVGIRKKKGFEQPIIPPGDEVEGYFKCLW